MNEHYYKRSNITGRHFDLFNSVSILNIQQICFYLSKNVRPMDIKVSQDKNGKNVLVFMFDKDESRDAYILWCNYGRGESDEDG